MPDEAASSWGPAFYRDGRGSKSTSIASFSPERVPLVTRGQQLGVSDFNLRFWGRVTSNATGSFFLSVLVRRPVTHCVTSTCVHTSDVVYD